MALTTKQDIDKVLLRCMRITDDAKITPVLAKFLSEFIKVYLEKDLNNVAPNDTSNEKLASQNELISHLKNRVDNSRGLIVVPAASLITVFTSNDYLKCENQLMKRYASELVFQFLALQLQYGAAKIDGVQFCHQIMTALASELAFVEKTRLFILIAWYFIQSNAEEKVIIDALNLTPVNRKTLLQFCLLYTIGVVADPYSHWQTSLKPAFCQFIDQLKPSTLTPVQHQARFDHFYLTTVLQNVDCFDPQDVLGIMICATQDQQSCSAGVRYECDSWLKNCSIDLASPTLQNCLFDLAHGNYKSIYHDCIPNFEKMNLIGKPSDNAFKWFIGWIMKLHITDNQKEKTVLIKEAIFTRQANDVHKQGLLLTRQLIREDPSLTKENAFELNNYLSQIISLSTYSQENQAFSLLLIAELGSRFFDTLGNSIDIALKVAQDLQDRIQEINGKIAVRADDLSLTYMEALNKFRDCYELNKLDVGQRDLLMQKIVHFLSSPEAMDQENGELLYILFLYVARLNGGKLSASLLLHSINLKDHIDIKIRKEAREQMERFSLASEESTKGILPEFLEKTRLLFVSMKNPLLNLVCLNDGAVRQCLQTNPNYSMHLDLGLIKKILELSEFALRFFLYEPSDHESVERLLLLNLNQNFNQLKSDFMKPLQLIKSYVMKAKGGAGLIESGEGCMFINKCAIQTTNINQRVLGLKLMFQLYSRQASLHKESDPFQPDYSWPKSHEQRMYWLYGLSLRVRFAELDQEKFSQLADEVTQGSVTPSQQEEQKFLSFCFSLMKWHSSYEKPLSVLLQNLKNRQLDPNYKSKLVQNLPKIVWNSESAEIEKQIVQTLDEMLDYDQFLVQTKIGKCFAKLWQKSNCLIEKTQKLMTDCTKSTLELNAKRNIVVYLYEVVNKYAAESQEIREKFVEIQQIFMRYLFDRKDTMQDLASKGLSLVYKLGNEEQKQLLIQSLQDSFSGAGPQQKKEQDDEKELLIDFSASTSQEQRDKLKTYKDLVRVAEELGQRDLIYQFLEVHRHNQQHQDIKNAAKGISSLLMLDDKIRGSLIKIAPKILLLTYDSNQEVKDTMQQLWASLIPVAEEATFIQDRWTELLNTCVKGIKSDQWRTRQAACLCLTDLVQSQSRTWEELSSNYRDLFLTSIGIVAGDSKDTVKKAAFKLVKAMRSFTLKYANLYSNQNIPQLKEVINNVVPLVLDDCMKSMITEVRKYGLHILCELIKTSQSQNLASKLKINNKHERALVLVGNSKEMMSQLLTENGFLPRIVSEMILNVSHITSLGAADILQADGKLKMDEQGVADLKMRYSRESLNGEILKICRSLMKQETFDQVLVTLLSVIQKGNHDHMTKLTACSFIQDIILENISLISPQNSKKIAQALVKVFSQQTVSSVQGMKESLVTAYAGAFGFQFKILREYPNTVTSIMKSVSEIDKDLLQVKLVVYFQAVKNLPNDFLQNKEMCQDFLPKAFIHKFDLQDQKLKKVSEKLWEHYLECWPLLSQTIADDILKALQDCFDSSSYTDRISASEAFGEIVKHSKDESIVEQTTQKLLDVIGNKYFMGKEKILTNLTNMLNNDLIEINKQKLLDSVLPQVQSQNLEAKYKNTLLKLLVEAVPKQPSAPLFQILIVQLKESLVKVVENSQASLLQESQGQFFDFDGQKEQEREVLGQVIVILELMPSQIHSDNSKMLDDVCCQYYGKTNWIVRKSVLECYKKLPSSTIFGQYLINQVGNCGEKYEYNLGLVSDITYQTLSALKAEERTAELKESANKIVSLLLEKDTELLKRNVDMIKQLLN